MRSQSKIQNSRIDWLFLTLLIFIPRLLNQDVFLTADEPLFLEHARDFARGLATGDLALTLGIGYPGVTVAWWCAPVVDLAPTDLGAYVAGRIAMAILTGLLSLGIYGLARRLLGRWPAFIGVALLALDPYSLAYGRLLHIAAPLALFMTLTGLSYLLWLRQAGRGWLFLTGLFTGLALLTKSTALLLGPMLVVSLIGWAWAAGAWPDARWWLRQVGALVVIALVAVAAFFALWPAMWVDPAGAVSLTFGKLFTDQEAGAGNLGQFWLGQFVQDPGPAFYPVAFLLKATPWLLAGLLLSLYQLISASLPSRKVESCQTEASEDFDSLPVTLCLWLFALTYLVLMSVASKKSIRYMLPAFPVFYLLAGQAFFRSSVWLRRNMSQRSWASRFAPHASRLNRSSILFTFIMSLVFVWFAFLYHPYYLTYYNPLLLGWRWAPQTLLVGWGEGLDEAARYLNDRPEATVSAWYEWLFPMFYQGITEAVVPQENLLTADQAVLYINQVQRDIPGPNIIHYFRTRRRPDRTVRLNGIDYAWVYPGPVAGFRPDPSPQHPGGGQFGDELHLLGYDLLARPRSGQPLIVTLYWRVLATPPSDRFVFVRLVDDQGYIWAKTDSPPVMGLWPASRWQPDMLIEDAQELFIPPGTPPGVYRLEVGLYDPATGQTLPTSGQPVGQGGGLLLGEVPVEWQALKVEPDLPNRADIRLASNARLIGYDSPPGTATTGDILPIRLGWREGKTLSSFWNLPNNMVMFEWQAGGERVAEQLDLLPLPIERWGRGATLWSQHQVIVPPVLETGQYDLVVGLHTGSDPAGELFLLGTVEINAPPHQFDLPAEALAPAGPAQLASQITLAGYNIELVDQALDLHLYWQTETALDTRYKVFAQLLAGDNTLVAQADSFPAAGQRSTTGWLPGEVITDPHLLALTADLPPGAYRLIAGFYNPATGERLPLLDDRGNSLTDAILVTEVTLP